MRLKKALTVSATAWATQAAAAPSGVTGTWRGHYDDEADLTTYTVVNAALGPASADRIVVVGCFVGTATGTNITGVTVGGIAATQIIAAPSSTRCLEFWFAQVPTGTVADISFTHSTAGSTRGSIDWWTITGTSQTTYHARSGSAPTSSGSASSITTPAFAVPAGGFAMAVCITNGAVAIDWSQASGTGSERADKELGIGAGRVASYDTAAASASQTITAANNGGGSTNIRIAAVSWGA